MARRKMTDEEKAKMAENKRLKHEKQILETDLKETKEMNIPSPAYLHKVGDRVVYGAWDFTKILEIFDGGKYYKCFSSTTNRNTNRGTVYSEKEHYETWYNLEIYRTKFPERLEEDEDIRFNYMQRDMIGLLSMMFDKYGIDLDPEYQRGNVWTREQKVNLIDSMFKNIDIGKFTIIKRPWGDNPNAPMTPKLYEMLDGKQRLTAVYEFFIGKFQYKGKYFHELHPRDRHHIKYYTINWAETQPLTKEQKYRYFLKLNTTGTPVSEEHLNKVRKLLLDENNKKTKTDSR